MFSIWWPVFLLPLAMVLGGVAGGVLPGRKYRGPRGVLPSEEQREADRVFCRFLWQFGLVYAALAFMVMRTVRLVSLSGQRWFLIGAVAVEIIGAALTEICAQRFAWESITPLDAPRPLRRGQHRHGAGSGEDQPRPSRRREAPGRLSRRDVRDAECLPLRHGHGTAHERRHHADVLGSDACVR